jgi:hypothetical protein
LTEPRRLDVKAPAVEMRALAWGDDGCASPDFAHWVQKVLPAASDNAVVEHAG